MRIIAKSMSGLIVLKSAVFLCINIDDVNNILTKCLHYVVYCLFCEYLV